MTNSNDKRHECSSSTHVFKGSSINSCRLRAIISESQTGISTISRKAASRRRKKIKRMEDVLIHDLPKTVLITWDTTQLVYLDGSGCGLPNHQAQGSAVIDARSASLILSSSTAKKVKDVCCLLPYEETRGVFTSKSYSFLNSMEKSTKTSTSCRGVSRQPAGTDRYMIVGTKASRGGRGVVDGISLLKERPLLHKEFSRILRNLEHRTARWIDSFDLKFLAASKKKANYPGFIYSGGHGQSDVWPSVACGKNTYLPIHTDKDYFLSAVTVCGQRSSDMVVLQYFCFPTLGISIELRHGDVLLFNPTIPHCISSPCSSENSCFSVSAYLKSLVVSGNSNI